MSAQRHLKDAAESADDLLKGLAGAMAIVRFGQNITFDEIAHLHRAAKATLARIAQAQANLPAEFDRRLPHSQTVNLDAMTQKPEEPGEFILDLLGDAIKRESEELDAQLERDFHDAGTAWVRIYSDGKRERVEPRDVNLRAE